jgi:hypothetical protein
MKIVLTKTGIAVSLLTRPFVFRCYYFTVIVMTSTIVLFL